VGKTTDFAIARRWVALLLSGFLGIILVVDSLSTDYAVDPVVTGSILGAIVAVASVDVSKRFLGNGLQPQSPAMTPAELLAVTAAAAKAAKAAKVAGDAALRATVAAQAAADTAAAVEATRAAAKEAADAADEAARATAQRAANAEMRASLRPPEHEPPEDKP